MNAGLDCIAFIGGFVLLPLMKETMVKMKVSVSHQLCSVYEAIIQICCLFHHHYVFILFVVHLKSIF